MKPLCFKCPKLAVWEYAPGKRQSDDYYCDDHVSRGCSCNLISLSDPNATEEYKDEQGRLLPCVEYMYSDKGFYIE